MDENRVRGVAKDVVFLDDITLEAATGRERVEAEIRRKMGARLRQYFNDDGALDIESDTFRREFLDIDPDGEISIRILGGAYPEANHRASHADLVQELWNRGYRVYIDTEMDPRRVRRTLHAVTCPSMGTLPAHGECQICGFTAKPEARLSEETKKVLDALTGYAISAKKAEGPIELSNVKWDLEQLSRFPEGGWPFNQTWTDDYNDLADRLTKLGAKR